jgi:alkanesulfonate monooxygenase SsuD/methylene tetrahydromethanopterin reductase-like flavin-dependent oxidoreductase (luciferase family)
LRRVRHPEGYRYQHHLGPLPVQQPHPPVLLGGTAAPALRRAGRLAQGWIGSSRHDLTEIGTYVETVRDGARGRPIRRLCGSSCAVSSTSSTSSTAISAAGGCHCTERASR